MLFDIKGTEVSFITSKDVQNGFVFDEYGLCDGENSAVKVVYGKHRDEIGEGHEEAFFSNALVSKMNAVVTPKVLAEISLGWIDNPDSPGEKVILASAIVHFSDAEGVSGTQGFSDFGKSVRSDKLSESTAFRFENSCLDKLIQRLRVFGIEVTDLALVLKGPYRPALAPEAFPLPGEVAR